MKKLIIILTIVMLTSCGAQPIKYDYNYTINVTFNTGMKDQIQYKCSLYSEPDFGLKNKKGTTYLVVYIGTSVYYIASEVMYFDIVNIEKKRSDLKTKQS